MRALARPSLAAFFRDYVGDAAQPQRAAIIDDDGYRTRSWSYARLASAANGFAEQLRGAGLAPGDRLVIWSENRREWIAALWGARLAGVVVVPLDAQASATRACDIIERVGARAVLMGAGVQRPAERCLTARAWWRMQDAALFNAVTAESGRDPGGGLAEILFTSGTTAIPKGVMLTDANILSNLLAVEVLVAPYRRWLRWVRPIRMLNLLPLSHMFGQSLAAFVPPIIGGTTVFSRGVSADDIVRAIRRHRVAALVCVPKVLEVLREHLSRDAAAVPRASDHRWIQRWWRYRAMHRQLGWRFAAFIVGGAPLDPALEVFWRDRGFLIIQGYGLTETAPIVTLTDPFRRGAPGSVGRPVAGVDLRIADDGEVLVRGANVTAGYYGADKGDEVFADGWFHTGDVGELDDKGRLTIKGRKKEMIVTGDGFNVFPDDVERVINAQPGVRESAVIGIRPPTSADERIHAVLVLDSAAGACPDAIVRAANAVLEPHQRIQGVSVWAGAELPRTEGTRKLRRGEIRSVTAVGPSAPDEAAPDAPERATTGEAKVVAIVSAMAGRAVSPETTFDELGLSSLDRVQLLTRLEEALDRSIDEFAFAAAPTVGDLSALISPAPARRDHRGVGTVATTVRRARGRAAGAPPSWTQSWPARAIRRVSLPTWVLALSRPWMSLTVEGLEHLDGLDHPVIFAPNHQSHMDTPAMLQALPSRWRYRVSPAMAKEWFKAHFFPEEYPLIARVKNRASYFGASLFYNCFPIPQYEAGTRDAIRYMGELFDHGRSVLIFPEGRRTEHGEIAVFRPGVAMIASTLGVPVVPVRIEGLDKVLSLRDDWPKRGPVRITFGAPLRLEGDNYAQLAATVRDAVVALQPYSDPASGSMAQ